VLKRAYFMTVIDGLFCVDRACDKQTRDAFQPSRLTVVRLWEVITLQTVWWETGGRRCTTPQRAAGERSVSVERTALQNHGPDDAQQR